MALDPAQQQVVTPWMRKHLANITCPACRGRAFDQDDKLTDVAGRRVLAFTCQACSCVLFFDVVGIGVPPSP